MAGVLVGAVGDGVCGVDRGDCEEAFGTDVSDKPKAERKARYILISRRTNESPLNHSPKAVAHECRRLRKESR